MLVLPRAPVSEGISWSMFFFQNINLISQFESTVFSPMVLSLLWGLTRAPYFYTLGIYNHLKISITG